ERHSARAERILERLVRACDEPVQRHRDLESECHRPLLLVVSFRDYDSGMPRNSSAAGRKLARVSSRAVLVTGASRGLGGAAARACAGGGDRVAVHYGANAGLAHEVAASLPGSGHVVVGADLADPDAVRRMVDEAAAGLGGLDVLVNNAGVFFHHPV